jgi:hypothetical protein
MTVPELLRAAAARVRRGWCQGTLFDEHDNVCALGAIDRLAENYDLAHAATEMLESLIGPSRDYAAIPKWNDAEGQTAENVATAMELAALCWEQQAHVEAQGVDDPHGLSEPANPKDQTPERIG